MLLSIVLAFCLLILQAAKTLSAHNHSDSSLHEAQLFTIYRVKYYVHEHANQQQNELDEPIDTNDDPNQNEKEFLQYQSHNIEIAYEVDHAVIRIDHLLFTISFDEAGHFITAPVYQAY